MMKISKMDEFKLKIKRVRDFNPLNKIKVTIELIFADPSTVENDGKVSIDEDEINTAMYEAYKGRFVNLLE